MGAGKTTIGRRVAELLGLEFFDLDHEIEVRTGATIPLIFISKARPVSERESAQLAELAARSGLVLSTGGGAVLDPANRLRLRERGFVVYLETTVEQQLSRLARDLPLSGCWQRRIGMSGCSRWPRRAIRFTAKSPI